MISSNKSLLKERRLINNSSLKRWQIIFVPILLSITTFIFYYSSLTYKFIFDDLPTITKNFHIIRDNNSIFNTFFSSNRWISRTLNRFLYRHWQTNTFPYRILNLSIHIIIGILIFLLLLKLISNFNKSPFLQKNAFLISTITSGLFLLHPVQTQTVTYITQMQLEGLVTLFTFIILLSFTYAIETKSIFIKTSLYILSFSLTALSAGTKEIIIVLPFLILAVDWFFIAQANSKKIFYRIPIHILFFVILFFSVVKLNWNPVHVIPTAKTAIANNRGNILTAHPKDKITPIPFFISQFKVILHYITMYFWPFNISFDYDYKLSKSFFDPDTIFPFLILLSIILCAVYLFIKDKTNVFSFIVIWFFISTLPRASFIPRTELACDYKSYLASFGIMLFLAILTIIFSSFLSEKINSLFKSKKSNLYQTAIICLIFLLTGYTTKTRNTIWSNEELFWKDAIKSAPNKPRNYNNYAVALAVNGKKQKAMQVYNQACELDPFYSEPIINMAFTYQAEGKNNLALKYYKKALKLNEAHPEMFHNLGILYLKKKIYKQAANNFKMALKIKPYYSKAHYHLGKTYHEQNKLHDAFLSFQKSLEGDFTKIDYFYMHAITAKDLKKYNQAICSFEKIKQTNPKYKNSLFALASCYYETRNYKKASENFAILYKKCPQEKLFAYNYAQSLLNTQNYKDALTLFEKCTNDLKKFPYANLHSAKCLALLGKKEEAIKKVTTMLAKTANQYVKKNGITFLKEITT
ncbi:tetratricopeptide repeat protein [Candidatus Dependentiae bacterium]